MTITDYRRFYADEIRIAARVKSEDLVRAFATVPRESYLGPPPWHICSGDQAALSLVGLSGDLYVQTDNPRDLYHNVLIAIDPTRFLNNGHPSTLAHWIASLDLKPGNRVYHAGCGVGYYTAILAEVVGPQGSVVAIDIDEALAARARQNLAPYPHVTVHAGDGADLDPGMCDAMLINAGVTYPSRIWLDRLNPGGSIVLPFTGKAGNNSATGVMAKLTREPSGFAARVISLVVIYSFTSLRDPEIEPLLTSALMKRDLFKMKSVILDDHAPSETCLAHTQRMCLSSKELES